MTARGIRELYIKWAMELTLSKNEPMTILLNILS